MDAEGVEEPKQLQGREAVAEWIGSGKAMQAYSTLEANMDAMNRTEVKTPRVRVPLAVAGVLVAIALALCKPASVST